MSIGPRAVIAGEHTLLQSEQQAAQLFALIDTPPAIFKARVNQDFDDDYDQIVQITFDGVTLGAYGDILEDMTLLIGSAEGLADRGVARIRKAATSSILYIGETSEIEIQDNDYLTVVAGYEPWAKHILSIKNSLKMDWDIAYSDQHADPEPCPVLGSDVVLELTGDDVTFYPDFSNSWVIGGEALTYNTTCEGASDITDGTTDSPEITFDTAGRYLMYCEVATATKSFTGVRVIHVLGEGYDPTVAFEISDIEDDLDGGGSSAIMTVYGDVSGIRDRSKVIIYAKEYLDLANVQQGPDVDRENLWMVGWIVGETIRTGIIDGLQWVTFEVYGEHYILDKETSKPVVYKDTLFGDGGGGAANRWDEFNGLTVPKALWSFLHYRTTLTRMTDVRIPTAETDQAPQLPAPAGSVWSQIGAIADGTILARACFDRIGRLWVAIDPQCTPEADRGSIPVVMELQAADRGEAIELRRTIIGEIGRLEVSGDYYKSGVITKFGAVAPGNTSGRFGDPEPIDGLVVASQADIIQKAGLVYGMRNNPYKGIPLEIQQINRFIGVWPPQYCQLTVATAINSRGLNLGTIKILPRQLNISYDAATGRLSATGAFDKESFQAPAVAFYFPGSDGGEPPGGGDEDEPPEPPPPTEEEEDPDGSDADVVAATATEVSTTDTFDEATPSWTDKTGDISGTIIDFYKTNGDDDIAYALTASEVYKTEDLTEASPTWAAVLVSDAGFWAGFTGSPPELLRIQATTGAVYVLAYSDQGGGAAIAYLLRSKNGGDTWTIHEIATNSDAFMEFTLHYYPSNLIVFTHPTGGDNSTGDYIVDTRETGATQELWAVGVSSPDVYNDGALNPQNEVRSDYQEGDFVTWQNGYPGDTTFEFQGGINSDYGSTVPWFKYARQLDAGEIVEILAYLDTLFGSGNYEASRASALNHFENSSRVNVGYGIYGTTRTQDDEYFHVNVWTIWRKPSLNVPKALAARGDVVYVGLADKIVVSRDGGVNWSDYIDAHGANDIHIPAYNNPDALNICYWSTAGGLYWTEGELGEIADRGVAMETETAQNVPYRIVTDPDSGFPMFTLTYGAANPWKLQKHSGGTTNVVVDLLDSIDGARSLRLYKGDNRRLFYMSSANIHYSDDDGEIWTDDKEGDWATYGSPVKIEALTP